MIAKRLATSQRLVSLTISSPGLDAWRFLMSTEGQERFYWHTAESNQVLAGFGATAELIAWGKNRFSSMEKQARHLFSEAIISSPTPMGFPRLFGGFAFRDDFVPDYTWAVFHPAHFILPHFQLMQVGSESWLTINTLIPSEEDSQAIMQDLKQALEARVAWFMISSGYEASSEPVCPPPVNLRFPMPPEVWKAMIEKAVFQIRSGGLRKVVLARASEIRCGGGIQVGKALRSLDSQYPGCYRFLFEPQPGHAFLGATPELLVRVNGSELRTMALAGSIRRGNTPTEDELLSAEMLGSRKERFEHMLVVQELRKRLQPRANLLSIAAIPEVLQFRNIQHLHTPVHAVLKRSEGVLRVLASLHPTPALGGSPREVAMDYIRQAEPVPRGWYAAPVGWLGPDLDGEFAVAIRSAVVQDRRAWLYAGAGIVAGSQPEQEWKETGLKFKPILQALDVEGIGEE